jgi:hypothetical protein
LRTVRQEMSKYGIICSLVAVGLVLAAACGGGVARATPPPAARAAVVVVAGNGDVKTVCVDLGSDGEATGLELLEGSGLSPVIARVPGSGAIVCRIGDDGCAYPDEPCFCQCPAPDGSCTFWGYYRLEEGTWQFSQTGAEGVLVQPGDVEGWAWGGGETSLPVIPFAEICGTGALPTATSTAAPTLRPTPTLTVAPTATRTPTPTLTVAPTATRTPTPTLTVVPTATRTPTPEGPPAKSIYLPLIVRHMEKERVNHDCQTNTHNRRIAFDDAPHAGLCQ